MVYTNDEFDCQYGGGASKGYIYLKENHAGRGALRGVMCIAELTTGSDAWEFYPVEKLEHIRSMSASYKYALSQNKVDKDKIWGDLHNTHEMYRKAVWRNMVKWLPKSGSRFAKAIEISDREFEEDFGHYTSARTHLSTYLSDEVEEDANDIGFITGEQEYEEYEEDKRIEREWDEFDKQPPLKNITEEPKEAFTPKDDPVEEFKPEPKKELAGYIHPAIEKLDDLFNVNQKAKLDTAYAITGRQEFDLLDYKDEQMNMVESMLQRMYDRLTGKRNGPERVTAFLQLALRQIADEADGWSLGSTREIDACISAFIQYERENK